MVVGVSGPTMLTSTIHARRIPGSEYAVSNPTTSGEGASVRTHRQKVGELRKRLMSEKRVIKW